jgi:hypothetical protein
VFVHMQDEVDEKGNDFHEAGLSPPLTTLA